MSVLHIAVLALVQGITEFLPVSSQGHLLLADQALVALRLIDAPPPVSHQLVLSVAVHVGTLGAVMAYFWRDLWSMLGGLGRAARGRGGDGARLMVLVIIATLPVIVAGFVFHQYGPWGLRSLTVIAWATIGFGVVLYFADRGMTVRRVDHLTVIDAVIVGCAQALALIPGTSRSGITMSAARMLGMERTEAARFSMLLAIPAITAAGALEGWELYQISDYQLGSAAGLAAGLAFAVAGLVIVALMAWLRRASFTPFVVYRLVLGVVLLGIAYGWAG